MHPTRILVVEDHASLSKLVDRVLSQAGFAVSSVGTDRDLADALATGAPDLLITDLDMDRLDARAIIASARDLDPEVAVLALTSWRDAGDLRDVHLLAKPFALTALVDGAQHALARH